MTRIEIHLTEQEVKQLDALAKSEGRSRKNFCETEIKRRITAVAVRQKKKN